MKTFFLTTALALGTLVTSARADKEQYYKAIADLVDTPSPTWSKVFDALNHVVQGDIDYRFFYFRAFAYYGVRNVDAGDLEALVAASLATNIPDQAERAKISNDLAAARRLALPFDVPLVVTTTECHGGGGFNGHVMNHGDFKARIDSASHSK